MMQEEAATRVLLVEDNPGDARLVEILLSETDSFGSFEITPAGRLDEALELLDGSAFEVVLLDLSLPDSSGLKTVNRVRTAAEQLPIVVLSGRDDEETALRALQSGAEDYLVKGRGDGELMARAIRYAIERKKAEENLAYLKQYDPLTGLANRTLFQDRLQQALARADRDGEMVALILLDLDHFKAVNDFLGHAGGDELLKEVAARIEGLVRKSDTVARLGADEFAIILEDMSDAQDVAPVAQDILDTLSESFVLDGHEIPVTASIGIAVRPPSEREGLLKDADAAVRRVKERGRNAYEFYTEQMNIRAFERLTLRNMLRRALREEEFLLHYEPQVDLATGAIVGAEALLRWQHPDLGLVPPARFIPLLEDTGDIEAVGRWVMQTACRQNKDWQNSGIAPLRVAVNLSARQFSRGGLMSTVADILEESGLAPGYLELEITESLLMEDIDASSQILNELKNVVGGLRISIDDFGTGYSSLSYLKSFPIDLLKIDRSFVQNVPGDPDDAAITTAIIRLAHSLRLGVIAEGVETEEQATFLRERGCDEAQGYYFSRPLPADEFAELLKAGGMPQGVSP
jgi:diguanylate cyclase (GGDEF)-like protein